jgi:hypothetical protein
MTIYLYVKQHSKTKLKYFGRTIQIDPYKYKGSGDYWTNHINKYGRTFVETLNIWKFDTQEECTSFALVFSEENNIVNSKEWANMIIETGLSNGSPKGRKLSKETCEKMSKSRKNKPCHNLDSKNKISMTHKGIPKTDSQKHKMRLAKLGKPQSEEHKRNRGKSLKRANALKRLNQDHVL